MTNHAADRRRLLLATGSKHKFAELSALLDLENTELVSLTDVGLGDDAPEEADSFEGNATSKAIWYAARSGLPALADDSGLEVDALDGLPGVRTRRFSGDDPTDADNNAHLLRLMEGVPAARRTARYRAFLALAKPMGDGGAHVVETATGIFEGRIATAPRGAGGFGYDPVFEPADEPVGGRTVAQLSRDEKNARSHRGMAAREMHARLAALGYR